MRAISEIRVGIGVLLTIQLFTTFGVVGLLTRMTPSLDRTIDRNVASLTASEQMLAALADQGCDLTDAPVQEVQFEEALFLAKGNASHPKEDLALQGVERSWVQAFAGDCNARLQTRTALQDLSGLHRLQMEQEQQYVERLANGGAWAAALLGSLAFAASLGVITRFTSRIAVPLSELEGVLAAVSRGDPYRRCRKVPAPEEYATIAVRLNQLLDRRLAREEEEDPQLTTIDRALLHHLMDQQPDPLVAVDTSGAILASSHAALDILAGIGVDSLSTALSPLSDTPDPLSIIAKVEPFGNVGFLITLRRPTVPQVPPADSPAVPAPPENAPAPAAARKATVPPPEPRGPRRPDEERD
jgi:hypothetical protein